jgi:hypothetical protein
MRALIPVLLLAAWSAPAAGQSGGWRFVPAAGPAALQHDGRLVLRGADRPVGSERIRPEGPSALLVIACGARLPEAQGRVLYFQAAEAMEPFGGEGFAEFRFDGRSRSRDTYLILPGRNSEPGQLAPRAGLLRLGLLGDDSNPYYSEGLLAEMLGARSMTVTYLAFGEKRSVRFELGGLAEALPALGPCDWAPPPEAGVLTFRTH